jgi:hypothetical protein
MTHQRKALGVLVASVAVLVACDSGESAEPVGPLGSISVPLEAIGSGGARIYRLIGDITIASNGEVVTVLEARNTSPPFLRADLPPGDYVCTLEDGDRIVEVLQEGATEPVPDAALQTERAQGCSVDATAETTVTFTYEIGGIPVGFGRLNIDLEVIDDDGDEPSMCPCWNGTVDASFDCRGRPCESLEDVFTILGPAVCGFTDFCQSSSSFAGLQCSAGVNGETSLELTVGLGGLDGCLLVSSSPTTGREETTVSLGVSDLDTCLEEVSRFYGDPGDGSAVSPCGLPNPDP